MPRNRDRGLAYRDRLIKLLDRGPQRPSDLRPWGFVRAFGRTVRELLDDNLTDGAATLTYYSIMSIFPGLLVLVAGVGLLGDATTQSVVEGIRRMTFGPAQQVISAGIEHLQDNRREAGIIAIVGLVVAFYSASGYVGAFIRAANRIYDVPEGRPLWKIVPLRLVITIVTGLFLAISVLAVVFTGRVADEAGRLLGVEKGHINAFDMVKWPVLVVAFGLLLALLYWAAPNARQGGFRWITPGSFLATFLWVAVTGGFAHYVSHFGSYDRVYGTLGGVIIFLVWMWLTNVAVLLGAEFDAELARERAIAAGLPRHAVPYLPLRDVPPTPEVTPLGEIPPLEHGERDDREGNTDAT